MTRDLNWSGFNFFKNLIADNITVFGNVFANKFYGDGSGLTNLPVQDYNVDGKDISPNTVSTNQITVSGDSSVSGNASISNLNVSGYATIANGLTIADKVTGQPYCITVANGALKLKGGDCSTNIDANINYIYWYGLNETEGTTADNQEGTSIYDGLVTTSAGWNPNGIYNGSYDNAGSGYYVSAPVGFDTLKSDDFTINFWFKLHNATSETYLFGDFKCGAGYYGAYIKIPADTAKLKFYVNDNDSTSITWNRPDLDVWTQLTIQFTKSSNTWEIFQNGVSQESIVAPLGGTSGNNSMKFLASGYGCDVVPSINGAVDEIQVAKGIVMPGEFFPN
ncbi:MAG: LamG-like jellyroll fold domain-containing protein [Candidatus Diapherotrites archaeon]|nr:LamG-like jellyroll fold domain-containing protein [Candidatus Diapherotrites archaeon]